MASIDHDLEGLTHDGKHDRPLMTAGWPAPRVELEGDVLRWTFRDRIGDRPGIVEARPRMLERFLRLGDAPADRVARYAAEFGVLHRPLDGDMEAMAGAEPVEWWRTLADEATAVLDLAAASRNPRATISSNDWARFRTMRVETSGRWWAYSMKPYGPLPGGGAGVVDAKQLLAIYLNGWLRSVRVGAAWSSATEAHIYMTPGGLLGALGLQLTQALARTAGLAVTCRGCSRSFSPAHGNQRYCQPCRDLREPQRAATKSYRRRRRET